MTNTMRTLTGIGVSPGSAIGPVAVVQPLQPLPATEPCSADPQQDLTRVADSLSVVADDLDAKAAKLEGDAAEMVAAAAMIARDPGLIEAVEQNLDGHTGPAHASRLIHTQQHTAAHPPAHAVQTAAAIGIDSSSTSRS